MEAVKLTKRVIDSALPRAVRYTVFDSAIPGFGLRVFPTGEKSWIFEYRPGKGGRRVSKKRITVGKLSDFTPDRARRWPMACVRRSRPARILRAPEPRSVAPTMSDVAKAFLTEHVEAKRKASTKAHYEEVINRLVLPKLGKLKAKDVTRAEIARLHLENSETPFQANRILAIVGSMYGFAGRHGLVPEGMNPARGIERFREDPRAVPIH